MGREIVVIGDAFLDEYLYGTIRGMSPEAPVPIFDIHGRDRAPGGAANTAKAAWMLGGDVRLICGVGNDAKGNQMISLMESIPIEFVPLEDRVHPTKTRFIAENGRQDQILRADLEKTSPWPEESREHLRHLIDMFVPGAKIIIVSDYGKGLIDRNIMMAIANRANGPAAILIDPKPQNEGAYIAGRWSHSRGTTNWMVLPNRKELSGGTPYSPATEDAVKVFTEAARKYSTRLKMPVLAKLDRLGSIFLNHPSERPIHTPSFARSVQDVTGAGDVVAAAMAVKLAARGWQDIREPLKYAMAAAAVAVSNGGTYTPSNEEVEECLTT